MAFDIEHLYDATKDRVYDRHQRFINAPFVKVLRTIGFDIPFERGEGAYLFDKDQNKYLDFLSGYGVFGLGRNHPVLRQTLEKVMNMNLPNLVKMGAGPLACLLAEKLVEKGGGRVVQIPYLQGYSTSEIIERIVKQNGASV